MKKIILDVSQLTDISESTLKKLSEMFEYCIAHNVFECVLTKQSSVKLDVGFGELNIYVSEDSIKYRFEPSKDLESLIMKSILNKESPIAMKLTTSLQEKIDKSYREYLD